METLTQSVAPAANRVTVNLEVIWSFLNKDFSEITENDYTDFVDQMLNHTELISKLPPMVGYAEKYRKTCQEWLNPKPVVSITYINKFRTYLSLFDYNINFSGGDVQNLLYKDRPEVREVLQLFAEAAKFSSPEAHNNYFVSLEKQSA
jgi:hypothetical protein